MLRALRALAQVYGTTGVVELLIKGDCHVKILFVVVYCWLFFSFCFSGDFMNKSGVNSQIGCSLKYIHMNPIVKQRAIDWGVTRVLTHKGDCFSLPSRIVKELKAAGYIAKHICYATNDRNHWGLIPIVQFWSENK